MTSLSYELCVLGTDDKVLASNVMTSSTLPRIGETIEIVPYEGPSAECIEDIMRGASGKKGLEYVLLHFETLLNHVKFASKYAGVYSVVDVSYLAQVVHKQSVWGGILQHVRLDEEVLKADLEESRFLREKSPPTWNTETRVGRPRVLVKKKS